MADLTADGKETKVEEVVATVAMPLTLEQRVEKAEKDIIEVARGVNVQAALLEGIVHAFDSVIKTYLSLLGKYVPPTVIELPNVPTKETK